MGMLYGWSVLLEPLEENLNAARSEVSTAYSLAFIFVTVGCFVTHRLLQWMSLHWLTLLVMCLGSTGIFIAGIGESLPTLILGYGIIFGFTSGVTYFLAVSACGIRSPIPHSVALSITVASFALGGVIWPPIYTSLIESLGVYEALLLSSAIILVGGFLSFFLFYYSKAKAPSADNNIGFFQDLLTNNPRVMIRLWVGFLLLSFAALMIMGHAAGMVKEWGGNDLSIGPMLPSLGYITGALIAGQICRFLPGRIVTVGMCTLATIALTLTCLAPYLEIGLLMLALVGLSFGMASTAYPTTIGSYYGVNEIPRIYGRQSISYGVGGLFGPLAAAAIFDSSATYFISIIVASILAFISIFVHLTLPRNNS
tara:strand:- start:16536 stop:17639 length:1104 start_codon:yes stop_codon:yes gene_type:complete